MYTRFLSSQTGTETMRQTGGQNVPVHRLSQTHSHAAMSKRGTPSMQSGFVRCSHIYTFIYIQTKVKKHELGPPARPIHNILKRGSTNLRPGLQFLSEEFFCCFLIVFIKKVRGEELFSFHGCQWQFSKTKPKGGRGEINPKTALERFANLSQCKESHRAQLSSSTTRDCWMLLV